MTLKNKKAQTVYLKSISISIITPSLNQGKFIEQTIQSVLSQAGNFCIDYIIADGGSKDNSIEIIKKYEVMLKSRQWPIQCKGISYRWWSRPDKGQANALNQAFEQAKGGVWAWINSDDYYEPGAFEHVMKTFNGNPGLDLIYGDTYIVDNIKGIKVHEREKQKNAKQFMLEGFDLTQPSIFFSRKSIERAGPLDETLQYVFDYDLLVKILKNGKGLYCPRVFSNFRIWENSKTFKHKKGFTKERRIVRKRHGLQIIFPKIINPISIRFPFSFIKRKYPKSYKEIENLFYHANSKFRYNAKN